MTTDWLVLHEIQAKIECLEACGLPPSSHFGLYLVRETWIRRIGLRGVVGLMMWF